LYFSYDCSQDSANIVHQQIFPRFYSNLWIQDGFVLHTGTTPITDGTFGVFFLESGDLALMQREAIPEAMVDQLIHSQQVTNNC
jgi:hypothetical protein